MKPFLKWAGGKSRLVEKLRPLLPADFRSRVYFEPFLGSGALFFALQPELAYLSDANANLIRTYRELRGDPIDFMREVDRVAHIPYSFLRDAFNANPTGPLFLVLNKRCFNGVYRVNAKGEFNVPEGRFATPPTIFEPEHILTCAALLQRSRLRCGSFLTSLVRAERPDAFVYLDPPYDASWTGYTAGGFDAADQEALADECLRLHSAGALWMLSNHDTPLVRELYAGFDIQVINAPRSVGKSRSSVPEVVVRNYS